MTLLDIENNRSDFCGDRVPLCGSEQVSEASSETNSNGREACLELMQSITQQEWSALTVFARCRLLRIGLNPSEAEDMVQDAVLAVLKGTRSASEGRHPRDADLADQGTFLDYLRGVIASLVESARRNGWGGHICDALGEISRGTQSLSDEEMTRLEFRDLHRQLFTTLGGQAPRRLCGLIDAWRDQGEDCDKIPLLGQHRRCRAELRRMAGQVLKRLIELPSSPLARKAKYEPTR